MMDGYEFGYPRECTKCAAHSPGACHLKVAPYVRSGNEFRLMLVGQDPTIAHGRERVQSVLMLDLASGRLTSWLEGLFGRDRFRAMTLYATNAVKCTFDRPPSANKGGGLKFLEPFFDHCKEYLVQEILSFRPTLLMTLGEPAHQLFVSLLEPPHTVPVSMKSAFTGRFVQVNLGPLAFDYTPCLHITTFRVAATYGAAVQDFQTQLSAYVAAKSSAMRPADLQN